MSRGAAAAGGTGGTTPPADLDGGTVPLDAVAAAVGLLTRWGCPGISRADVLGDVPPERALVAMEILARAFLEAISPDDKGASVLQRLGLLAAAEAARQLPEGP